MVSLPFTRSLRFTTGTELELQLIDRFDARLVDKADSVLADMGNSQQIKPELTKSMIELNSSVHTSVLALHEELSSLARNVREVARRHGCDVAGGGRHLDGDWREQVISDLQRHQNLAVRYGYITKMACVFGQHIHIGVQDGDEAIYLCHALIPYLPHLVALSASSPWLNGVDTSFSSSRFTGQNAFLNSELIENIYNWNEFVALYHELTAIGIIKSIKDIYWYVRPQPALGTIEIRICDMPLTIFHAAMLTGYSRILVQYLLANRVNIVKKHHAVEKYDIFNARRDGLQASYVSPLDNQRQPLAGHILHTVETLTSFTRSDEDSYVLQYIAKYVKKGVNDSDRIRSMIKRAVDLDTVMERMRKMLLSAPRNYKR
ncbi:YbdK family carboxylate-amine ligase [Enterobacter sp. R1(2018)]|uniref:YbdK family carboxylate-amine ligase n=1 Tax=Enterobacter sp. R1(2018) TaxID=2447891 RepID=UPI000EAE494E|nr:YbdK family carboxylate-amine ligase [Enterobacter sp. R1(2018)]RKQ38963.1 YbdK family carboxylate-amine ligase [Enterobacter sp. R1(2018)]